MDAYSSLKQQRIVVESGYRMARIVDIQKLLPWLAGSGVAMGQAVLATACTLPTVGKCAGCGSCVVAVATLSTWALKRRKADAERTQRQGLEPFEIRTASTTEDQSLS